jgi:hypothetical protein
MTAPTRLHVRPQAGTCACRRRGCDVPAGGCMGVQWLLPSMLGTESDALAGGACTARPATRVPHGWAMLRSQVVELMEMRRRGCACPSVAAAHAPKGWGARRGRATAATAGRQDQAHKMRGGGRPRLCHDGAATPQGIIAEGGRPRAGRDSNSRPLACGGMAYHHPCSLSTSSPRSFVRRSYYRTRECPFQGQLGTEPPDRGYEDVRRGGWRVNGQTGEQLRLRLPPGLVLPSAVCLLV